MKSRLALVISLGLLLLLLYAYATAQSSSISLPLLDSNGNLNIGTSGSTGKITIFGSTGGGVGLTVPSSTGNQTATVPNATGTVALGAGVASNLGDVICSSGADTALNSGSVGSVKIVNGGSGYGTTPPTLTFTGGTLQTNGVAATATAGLTGGVISSVTITSGFGYSALPTGVTVSPVMGGASITTPNSCENTSSATTELAFATTYTMPANLLTNNKRLRITAGLQLWSNGLGPTINVRVGPPGTGGIMGTQVYTSGVLAPAVQAGAGTQMSWDFIAPSTTSLICSNTFPSLAGIPGAQVYNQVSPQPVASGSVINTATSLPVVITATYSAVTASNAIRVLWLAAEVLN